MRNLHQSLLRKGGDLHHNLPYKNLLQCHQSRQRHQSHQSRQPQRKSFKDTAEMTSSYLLPLLACLLFACSSAQKSCRGRCGEAYYRGNACQCDYECLSHKECCKNYESLCTTGDSCKGRCGEPFKRGQQCHCDIECVKFKQCCPDYEAQCTVEDTALQPERTADSPQRTSSLCQNSQCNKPTECSTEEESNDPPATTVAPEDDYDPDEGVIVDGAPVPEVASGSEPLPSAAPEDKAMDPGEIEPTLPPVLPEVDPETNEVVKEALELAETEESSPRLPEEQSASVPSTTISSSPSQTTQAPPTETTDLKDPPVPEEDPESPQAASESEHSPFSSASTLPPLVTSTKPTTTQQPSDQPSDQPPFPTSPAQAAGSSPTPASEQPDQDAQANAQSTSDPKTTLPPTAHPNDFEIDSSNSTDLKPTNPDQNEEVLAPETKPEPQTEQLQLEPSENATSDGVSATNSGPTEKPSAAEPTKPREDVKDSPSTKAPSATPATPASEKVDPSPTKAPEKVLDEGSTQDYQADANNDTNICSGRPVNGLTTLRNGTIVVFRGHYFWTLDSRRNPGPPLGITDVWGIPSPIDTVYTRCNCQGKTYFFKGENYWRFENGIMDSGFPRPISAGFGLSGQITAALSMPQYRSRTESVFFFKKGGLAQRYNYRITPQCGRSTAVYTLSKKVKRQADPELGREIDVRKTWRGFPPAVTSAVSVPSTGGDGYKYYIFSRTKYYSLKMEGDTPVILTPRDGPGKQKSAKSWFRCPETQRL
ncbi:hypothetical protein AOLI_G00029030 [Acnodon oligacanthus]